MLLSDKKTRLCSDAAQNARRLIRVYSFLSFISRVFPDDVTNTYCSQKQKIRQIGLGVKTEWNVIISPVSCLIVDLSFQVIWKSKYWRIHHVLEHRMVDWGTIMSRRLTKLFIDIEELCWLSTFYILFTTLFTLSSLWVDMTTVSLTISHGLTIRF